MVLPFDMADLIFYGLLLAVILVVAGFQIRYYFRRLLSQNWPTTTAVIKPEFVGVISQGAGAGFFGYVFTLKDVEYSGRFVLPDNWGHAEQFQRKLDGVTLLIKFHRSNPKVSMLANFNDPVFEGLVATQNPYWFFNARERRSMLALDLNKK
jgi:hypothetical protein